MGRTEESSADGNEIPTSRMKGPNFAASSGRSPLREELDQKLAFVDSCNFRVKSSVRAAREAASQRSIQELRRRRRDDRSSSSSRSSSSDSRAMRRRRMARVRMERKMEAPAWCRNTYFSHVSGYGAAGCVVGSLGGQENARSAGVLGHRFNEVSDHQSANHSLNQSINQSINQ